jgi:hypothetical protein
MGGPIWDDDVDESDAVERVRVDEPDDGGVAGCELKGTGWPSANGIWISRMRAKSDAYARSEVSNSINACVRLDIVGGVGGRDEDKTASSLSSSRGDMADGESGLAGSICSPSGDGKFSPKPMESNSPDSDS